MKIELNFIKDRDGNPCVAISSPTVESGVVKEITIDYYEDIMDILNGLSPDEKGLIHALDMVTECVNCEETKNDLHITIYRNTDDIGINHCTATVMTGNVINEKDILVTSISNREYKKYCRGSILQKLDVIYNTFKDLMGNGTLNK